VIRSLFGFIRFVFLEFGALIVFWIVLYGAGIEAAIAATVAFILLDGAYRWWRKIPVTRIYLLTSALAVTFGCVDLLAANPFMIKFEAVITNVATGAFFAAGARGEKSLIQEVAEKRNTFPRPRRCTAILPAVHAVLGRLFFRQSRRLSLAWDDLPARTGSGAAHGARWDQSRLHVRDQYFPLSAAVLSVPPPRAFAGGRDGSGSAGIQLISRSTSQVYFVAAVPQSFCSR
jgi:hypothetical protein